MYQVQYSDKILEHLQAAYKVSPSIADRLLELEDNPLARAKPTNMPAFGDYYVNAGRYCILFDVDQNTETVTILSVRQAPYVHKLLTGRI
jgi:mRNA-degrading endonuclease RelE of RelBE toxin-antitoxin system